MMFNSKKQTTPKLPWAIQVLTTEYMIDGSVQPDEYSGIFQPLNYRGGPAPLQLKTWKTVQIQPTGNLTMPVPSFSAWTLGCAANVVAIIPNDDASRQDALKAFKDWKYPIKATIFAGPYCIRGTVMAPKANGFQLPDAPGTLTWTNWGGGGFPIMDAEVDSLLPGAKLTGLRVPWLLLNAWVIQGFGLE